MTGLRVIACGAGVQSTALVVLAARGVINYDTALMANVGDDSEDPRTLTYAREVLAPYAASHGIAFHLLDRRKRDGSIETLWGRLMRDGSRSLPIPVRMSNGAPGNRSCTADFKIRVTGKWLKEHGATKKTPATVAIGISLDEATRANNRRSEAHEVITYPLIGVGEETGLKMTRQDCARLIASEGLPVPGKSSCFFCPFHRPPAWVELRRNRPDLFAKACELEETLNDRRTMLGKDPVWLTRFAQPLRTAIAEPEALLPGFDDAAGECDSGWCFT